MSSLCADSQPAEAVLARPSIVESRTILKNPLARL
jgi:hypothetical protein